MFTLRTRDYYGNEISQPKNAPIISIQMDDPVIELLENYIDPDDNSYTLADLLRLIKLDIEVNSEFLKDDLNRLFKAVGMEEEDVY